MNTQEWPTTIWRIVGAMEARQQCWDAARTVSRKRAEDARVPDTSERVKAHSGDSFFYMDFKNPDGTQSGFLRYSYQCLPDTVDPRGPKGK